MHKQLGRVSKNSRLHVYSLSSSLSLSLTHYLSFSPSLCLASYFRTTQTNKTLLLFLAFLSILYFLSNKVMYLITNVLLFCAPFFSLICLNSISIFITYFFAQTYTTAITVKWFKVKKWHRFLLRFHTVSWLSLTVVHNLPSRSIALFHFQTYFAQRSVTFIASEYFLKQVFSFQSRSKKFAALLLRRVIMEDHGFGFVGAFKLDRRKTFCYNWIKLLQDSGCCNVY